MSPEEKRLAESIRSGKYFESARDWFHAIYIGPISERTFFLIIALLSAVIAVTSIVALFSLLPLTDKRPILVYAGDRPEETLKKLVQIKTVQQPLNPSLKKFFVAQYVKLRESYYYSTYLSSAHFIHQHSVGDVYTKYITQNDVVNPSSSAARLGEHGQRVVTIDLVTVEDVVNADNLGEAGKLDKAGNPIKESNPANAANLDKADGLGKADKTDKPVESLATVQFSTHEVGSDNENKTRWTARIKFSYTDMHVSEAKNPQTGKIEVSTTDPKFQVLSYELEQK